MSFLKEKLGLMIGIVVAALGLVSGAAPVTSLNVTQFGATGNGSTDDTAAIKKAIASLPSSGGAIYFPCGTYAISSELSIRLSNTTVTGPATGCVTLKAIGKNSFTMLDVKGGGGGLRADLGTDATGTTFTVTPGALARMHITPGSYLVIQDTLMPSGPPGSVPVDNREVVKITALKGDVGTIDGTFSHPFYIRSPYPQNQGGKPFAILVSMITNVSVEHLAFDGSAVSGSGTRALSMQMVVNSTAAYLSASNFLTNAQTFVLDTGYNNNVHDIVCNRCGNGPGGEGFWNAGQNHLTESNVTITQSPSQDIMSFTVRQVHWSTFSNIHVDAKGAHGRVVKLQRADHNTFNRLTALNGTGQDHGICITDVSQYNTFNDCVAENIDGGGIVTFGNFNQHNTFNNCTSQFNTASQFGQSRDGWGHFGDNFTTINGGFYGNQRTRHANLVTINTDDFIMDGATVRDDNHVAGAGLVFGAAATNPTVTNNTFVGLPPQMDIWVVGTPSGHFGGNSTPDGTTPRRLPP